MSTEGETEGDLVVHRWVYKVQPTVTAWHGSEAARWPWLTSICEHKSCQLAGASRL